MAELSTLGASAARARAVFRRADLPASRPGHGAARRSRALAGRRPGQRRHAHPRRPTRSARPSSALSAGLCRPDRARRRCARRWAPSSAFRSARFDEAPGAAGRARPEGGDAARRARARRPRDVRPRRRAERASRGRRRPLRRASPTIPQAAGAESLNVAVAGAIALYELRRRARRARRVTAPARSPLHVGSPAIQTVSSPPR